MISIFLTALTENFQQQLTTPAPLMVPLLQN